MKGFWILFGAIIILPGCGAVGSGSLISDTPLVVEETDVSPHEMYSNTQFGYAFEIPEGMTVYAVTDDQTAVHADESSRLIFLVDGETNFFTIRVVEDVRSTHEWLSQNLSFFYPTGEAAQRVGEIAGEQAIFLRGAGTNESPAQVIVFQLHGALVVISYEQETEVFQQVINNFISLM
ncbi:hypothetical protein HQ487_02045 [Candidatus Uhrbacteria bacterium]|nr:hypothetical protein [Candidatus Uhrbacteria bacterium]